MASGSDREILLVLVLVLLLDLVPTSARTGCRCPEGATEN
jgi:hypothetical protein